MTRLLTLLVLLLPLAGSVTAQSDGPPSAKEDARAAAESWLARIDADEFGASWEAASTLLRQRIERAEWVQNAEQLRDTVKTVSDRTLTATRYRESLRRAPNEGPFVLLAYRSSYEAGPLDELLVTVREDTTWKVAGYRVTPRRSPTTPEASRP